MKQVENNATLPGVRSPSRTSECVAVPRGGAELRGGEFRQPGLASTPNVASSALRIGGVRFTALTIWVTTGIPANMPVLSVDDRMVSRSFGPFVRRSTALARSIRCGKSRFHSCGGTGISTCSTCRTGSIDRRRP